MKEVGAERSFFVSGLSIGGSSSVYSWCEERIACDSDEVVTLFPGSVAERVALTKLIPALIGYFYAGRPDVVFVPGYWPLYSLLTATIARLCGANVVLMCDSHANSEKRPSGLASLAKRLSMTLYSAALAGGAATKRHLINLGFGRDRIYDGCDAIDNDFFSRRAEAETLVRPVERNFLSFVGRLVWEKNLAFRRWRYSRHWL